MQDLQYDFHDAVVVRCDYTQGSLVLLIELYEVFYPKREKIQLTFSGVLNSATITRLAAALHANQDPLDVELGWRINNLQYNTRKRSTDADLHFFLDIDNFAPVSIHCKRLDIKEYHQAA